MENEIRLTTRIYHQSEVVSQEEMAKPWPFSTAPWRLQHVIKRQSSAGAIVYSLEEALGCVFFGQL